MTTETKTTYTRSDAEHVRMAEAWISENVQQNVSALVERIRHSAEDGGAFSDWLDDTYELFDGGVSDWYYQCSECGEDMAGDGEPPENATCQNCKYYMEVGHYAGTNHHQVYEHYLVSDRGAAQLRDVGEKVVELDDFGLRIWCRTCTGQGISMDPTVYDILSGMSAHAAKQYTR